MVKFIVTTLLFMSIISCKPKVGSNIQNANVVSQHNIIARMVDLEKRAVKIEALLSANLDELQFSGTKEDKIKKKTQAISIELQEIEAVFYQRRVPSSLRLAAGTSYIKLSPYTSSFDINKINYIKNEMKGFKCKEFFDCTVFLNILKEYGTYIPEVVSQMEFSKQFLFENNNIMTKLTYMKFDIVKIQTAIKSKMGFPNNFKKYTRNALKLAEFRNEIQLLLNEYHWWEFDFYAGEDMNEQILKRATKEVKENLNFPKGYVKQEKEHLEAILQYSVHGFVTDFINMRDSLLQTMLVIDRAKYWKSDHYQATEDWYQALLSQIKEGQIQPSLAFAALIRLSKFEMRLPTRNSYIEKLVHLKELALASTKKHFKESDRKILSYFLGNQINKAELLKEEIQNKSDDYLKKIVPNLDKRLSNMISHYRKNDSLYELELSIAKKFPNAFFGFLDIFDLMTEDLIQAEISAKVLESKGDSLPKKELETLRDQYKEILFNAESKSIGLQCLIQYVEPFLLKNKLEIHFNDVNMLVSNACIEHDLKTTFRSTLPGYIDSIKPRYRTHWKAVKLGKKMFDFGFLIGSFIVSGGVATSVGTIAANLIKTGVKSSTKLILQAGVRGSGVVSRMSSVLFNKVTPIVGKYIAMSTTFFLTSKTIFTLKTTLAQNKVLDAKAWAQSFYDPSKSLSEQYGVAIIGGAIIFPLIGSVSTIGTMGGTTIQRAIQASGGRFYKSLPGAGAFAGEVALFTSMDYAHWMVSRIGDKPMDIPEFHTSLSHAVGITAGFRVWGRLFQYQNIFNSLKNAK